jgi:hypothetical protein
MYHYYYFIIIITIIIYFYFNFNFTLISALKRRARPARMAAKAPSARRLVRPTPRAASALRWSKSGL